jgi:hypothetical protein
MRIHLTVVAILAVLMCCLGAAQEIYTYVDENGTIHFTDQPKPGWRRVSVGPGGHIKAVGGVRSVSMVGSSIPHSNLINAASAKYEIDSRLIAAVMKVESDYNPRVVSHAGAKGLMQLMDSTAAMYGVTNSFDPAQNVNAGSRHLRNLLDAYDGNLKLALAAYNAGQGAVARHGGVPPYKETRRYIQKIAAIYGSIDPEISDAELDTSFVAARVLARGERFIYRYETRNGYAYSEVVPTNRAYVKIDLFR